MLNLVYYFSSSIPRSSKPTTFTAVPIGSSSGFCIFGKNPEILIGFINSEVSSNSITTQAYGVKSSNPAGGTVIIVYVTTFPAPFIVELENPLLPHFLQKYTVARCNSPHFMHFLARTLPAFAASINSGFADNLHTLKNMNRTACACCTKILC